MKTGVMGVEEPVREPGRQGGQGARARQARSAGEARLSGVEQGRLAGHRAASRPAQREGCAPRRGPLKAEGVGLVGSVFGHTGRVVTAGVSGAVRVGGRRGRSPCDPARGGRGEAAGAPGQGGRVEGPPRRGRGTPGEQRWARAAGRLRWPVAACSGRARARRALVAREDRAASPLVTAEGRAEGLMRLVSLDVRKPFRADRRGAVHTHGDRRHRARAPAWPEGRVGHALGPDVRVKGSPRPTTAAGVEVVGGGSSGRGSGEGEAGERFTGSRGGPSAAVACEAGPGGREALARGRGQKTRKEPGVAVVLWTEVTCGGRQRRAS